MLPRMIRKTPVVTLNADGVQIDVVNIEGKLVERVEMSPHVALALAERLRAEAISLLNAGPGAAVVPLKREAEGH